MARAYFRYTPSCENKDMCTCDLCDAQFTNFEEFKGNPIVKHACINTECMASKLGALLNDESNYSLESAASIFSSSYPETFNIPIREELSSLGFIYPNHCISCSPKINQGIPCHKEGCEIKLLMLRLRNLNKVEHSESENGPKEASKNTCVSELGALDNTKEHNSILVLDKEPSIEMPVQNETKGVCEESKRPDNDFPLLQSESWAPSDIAKSLQDHKLEIIRWYREMLDSCCIVDKEDKWVQTGLDLNEYTAANMKSMHLKLISLLTNERANKLENMT